MWFRKLFKRKTNDTPQPTAVEYVEWLIKHMLQTSRMELVIDTKRKLPDVEPGGKLDPPPCLPENLSVINRLKILSRVNPVLLSEKVTASFERPRNHCTIEVHTTFEDSPEHSLCSLRLKICGSLDLAHEFA